MDNHHGLGHRFNHIDRLRSPERLARLEVKRVTDLALDGNSIQSVLDIGTGTAVFAEAFSGHGRDIAGIDVNPEMLETAQKFVPQGDFRQATAEVIPFPDRSFDLSFMGLVLHETDDLLKALQEAFRVTRLRLGVLEWPYTEQDFGPGMEERLEPSKIQKLAAEAGFTRGEVFLLENLVFYRFDKEDVDGNL
jgi:ubiquinone/menaquinone biosynthesis C-methylase UbiE